MGNNVVNHRHGQTNKKKKSLQINAHIKIQETKEITKNWRERDRERKVKLPVKSLKDLSPRLFSSAYS